MIRLESSLLKMTVIHPAMSMTAYPINDFFLPNLFVIRPAEAAPKSWVRLGTLAEKNQKLKSFMINCTVAVLTIVAFRYYSTTTFYLNWSTKYVNRCYLPIHDFSSVVIAVSMYGKNIALNPRTPPFDIPPNAPIRIAALNLKERIWRNTLHSQVQVDTQHQFQITWLKVEGLEWPCLSVLAHIDSDMVPF